MANIINDDDEVVNVAITEDLVAFWSLQLSNVGCVGPEWTIKFSKNFLYIFINDIKTN